MVGEKMRNGQQRRAPLTVVKDKTHARPACTQGPVLSSEERKAGDVRAMCVCVCVCLSVCVCVCVLPGRRQACTHLRVCGWVGGRIDGWKGGWVRGCARAPAASCMCNVRTEEKLGDGRYYRTRKRSLPLRTDRKLGTQPGQGARVCVCVCVCVCRPTRTESTSLLLLTTSTRYQSWATHTRPGAQTCVCARARARVCVYTGHIAVEGILAVITCLPTCTHASPVRARK